MRCPILVKTVEALLSLSVIVLFSVGSAKRNYSVANLAQPTIRASSSYDQNQDRLTIFIRIAYFMAHYALGHLPFPDILTAEKVVESGAMSAKRSDVSVQRSNNRKRVYKRYKRSSESSYLPPDLPY